MQRIETRAASTEGTGWLNARWLATRKKAAAASACLALAVLAGCGGGGGGDAGTGGSSGTGIASNTPTDTPTTTTPAPGSPVATTPSPTPSSPAPASPAPASPAPAPTAPVAGDTATTPAGPASAPATAVAAAPAVIDTPRSRAEAARFLTQATFGPTDADIDSVTALGYSAWIDQQLAKPFSSHRATWEASDAAAKSIDPKSTTGQDGVLNSFWKKAVTADDQLRQRVAYALSQIFVISMQDGGVGNNPRGAASYLDMLGENGVGNYRSLLEGVAMHSMMGTYLTSIRNQKADPKTGRVPDENFAREVMQLMSIGLHQLNADGSLKQFGALPIDTYSPADIAGMARVFTGWSWACPAWPNSNCFFSGSSGGVSDPDRAIKPMVAYPAYHSTEEKKFLGVTIPAQAVADPAASVKTALDTLFNHPNVGPFIGKQLIQRLVTSNPSPQYVAAVAAAFANNGAGQRGDMKAVVKAVLMNPEARTSTATSGKLREPVLKLSVFLRAFPFTSDSGEYQVGNTDNPATALGQSPMRSPSVFNFYRPGYVPPGTKTAAASLVAPEMQLAQETSAAGYVNYMRDNVISGVGRTHATVGGVTVNRRDLQPDYTAELALADQPAALLDRLSAKLLYGGMTSALKTEIQGALQAMPLHALNATASNQAQVTTDRRNRVGAAVLLVLVSPEFQVQK